MRITFIMVLYIRAFRSCVRAAVGMSLTDGRADRRTDTVALVLLRRSLVSLASYALFEPCIV